MKYIFMGVIVPCSAIIPIAAAIIRHRHLNSKCWYIFLYLCITSASNIASRILAANHTTNMPLLHAYTVIEMFLFSIFFIQAFQSRQIKNYIRILIVLFPLFCLINFTYFQSIYQFNTYTRPVEAIIIIILSLLYWFKQEKPEDDERQWSDVAENWIISGILLYFSSTLFLFIFSNYLYSKFSIEANKFIWNLHGGIVIFMYLFFAIAFFKSNKNDR